MTLFTLIQTGNDHRLILLASPQLNPSRGLFTHCEILEIHGVFATSIATVRTLTHTRMADTCLRPVACWGQCKCARRALTPALIDPRTHKTLKEV